MLNKGVYTNKYMMAMFSMTFNAHYDTEPLSLWGRFLAGLATQPEKKMAGPILIFMNCFRTYS